MSKSSSGYELGWYRIKIDHVIKKKGYGFSLPYYYIALKNEEIPFSFTNDSIPIPAGLQRISNEIENELS